MQWVWLLWVPALAAAEPSALQRDARALLRPESLAGLALAFGAAGLAHQWDDELVGPIDNGLLEPVLDFGNFFFKTKHCVGSVATIWGGSKVASLDEVHAASGAVLRALVLSSAMVGPLKLISGRTRPDISNDLSFPSGHSANAFAIGTVLARRYGRRVGAPLLALAATVPAARVHERHHFFSDVVAGSILGAVAGWAVDRAGGRALSLAPVYIQGMLVVHVRWRS